MKFSLGNYIPTDPAPTDSAAIPKAPEGYWVNPSNVTQWLPPDQGAQVGDICFFGTGILPGRLRAGGNQANTKLYCGCLLNSSVTDSIVFYGGAAVLAYMFVPAPYKWYVAGPLAALALAGAAFGKG